MFGLIIGAASLLFGIGSSIFSANKEKKAAEKQADQTEAQYNAKAAQTYNAGIAKIGDLQLGLAASGVKYNSQAGEASLESVRNPESKHLKDYIDKGGAVGGIVGSMKDTASAVTGEAATALEASKKSSQNTGTLLLQQSRASLARDVETIRETGVANASSISEQGQQDLYSSIFGTVSNTLNYGASVYGSYASSGSTNFGQWLKEW